MPKLYNLLGKPKNIIDTHCHINDTSFEIDRNEIINNAKENNIEIWDVATSITTSKKSLSLSKKFNFIKSFIGIDPEIFIPGSNQFIGFNKKNLIKNKKNIIKELINNNLRFIKGIGETGLDYYWISKNSKINQNLSKSLQEELFRMHLALAQEFELPLSIHSRMAEKDCLKIVKEYNVFGIFHSYTGDLETAKEILKAGWGLGINGIVTFKNSKHLLQMYKELLLNKKLVNPIDFYKEGIFFETDSPFLSPEGKRGQKNNPNNILDVFNLFKKILIKKNPHT